MEIGVDMIALDRIRIMEQYYYSSIIKLLTEKEVQDGRESEDPARYYAECMACKEAVFKCLDERMKISFLREIEFDHLKSGKPCVNIYGTVKELFEQKKLHCINLSISYEQEYVIAFALAY